jgi:hypothetical protein
MESEIYFFQHEHSWGKEPEKIPSTCLLLFVRKEFGLKFRLLMTVGVTPKYQWLPVWYVRVPVL